MMKMKGLILTNAYYCDKEYLYQAERLQEEFGKRNVPVDIFRNDDFRLRIENGNIVSDYNDYDFCVFWDKDKYVMDMLGKLNIRLFNSVSAIEKCDDKMTTYIELTGCCVPMPDTMPGLLCFDRNAVVDEKTVEKVEKAFGYPLIAKQSFGSRGKEVYLVNDREELRSRMEQMKCVPHLFQKYIGSSYGKDLRIIVVGNEVVGGMLRQSEGDFRSNICAGGAGKPYPVSDGLKETALKIKEALGLDYCGIDVLFGENGPVVCEVNSNAFFCEFERATGINVAGKYADYILESLSPLEEIK